MLEFLQKFSHRSTAVSDIPAPLPTVPEALTHHLPVGKALYSDLQALRFQGTRERQVTPQGHDATKQPVCGSTLLKPDFPLPGTCAHLHANLLPTDPIVLMTPPGYKEGLAWAHACVNERISCLVDLDPPEQRPAHCMDRDRIHEGVFLRADFKREPDTAPPSGISAVERFEVSLQHLPQPGDAARTQRVRRLVAPIVPNEPVKPQQVLDLVQAIEDQEQVEGRTVAFQCSDDHSAGLMAVALAAYRRLKNGDEVSVEDLNDFVLQKCAEVRASRNVDIFEARHLTTLVAFNHLALTRQKEKAPTGARCMSGGAVAPFENTACAGATALAATRSPMPVGLCAVREDITKLEVDAIVNAAKPSLEGGGGVDGAIHRAAGRKLRQFCKTLGGCETGQAKVTPGFELPARLIVHTVGPIWRGGTHDEARLLADCYRNALEAALSSNARSVAFPCISTGSYGFPADEAAKIAVRTATDFLARSSAVMNVIFCCSSARDLQLYQRELGLVRA